MFVLPDYFRRGIGRAMMRHLERIAREHGLKNLMLDATLNAATFYRSQGFQGDTAGTYHSPRGIALECVPMMKSLADS
jgi:ribosomal protein S18 acetylase RimI-like enzyme